MEVSVDHLRKVSGLLFSHLERHGLSRVELKDDFYWDVPADIRYDQYTQPTTHTLGQLTDDLGRLNRIADGDLPVISYGLVWLAAVLRRMGETANC